jgi:nickel-type superoxide dismutase maturation protease
VNHLLARLQVTGESMVPTLLPGDRVLAVRGLAPRVGDLVAVTDPRDPGRVLVKRVVAIEPGGLVVGGDNGAASTDSRHFGPIGPAGLRGRVVYRYHPDHRRGRLTKRALTKRALTNRAERRWKLPPGETRQ